MAKEKVKPYYSEVLKRQVVREYESGHYSKENLSLKYGILGSNTLTSWVEKYRTGNKGTEMGINKEQVKRIKAVRSRLTEQDRISELEKQLAISRQREQLYLRIIEVSGEELGEDLLKKIGIGLLGRQAEKGG
jgi:transposase-like protein